MIIRKWYTPVYRYASYEPYDGTKPDVSESYIEHTEDITTYTDKYRPELDLEIYTYRQNDKIVEQLKTYYPKGDKKIILFREKVREEDYIK